MIININNLLLMLLLNVIISQPDYDAVDCSSVVEQFASEEKLKINVHKMRSAIIQNFKNTDSRGGTNVPPYLPFCVRTYVCGWVYTAVVYMSV